jgi:hypothetical protein
VSDLDLARELIKNARAGRAASLQEIRARSQRSRDELRDRIARADGGEAENLLRYDPPEGLLPLVGTVVALTVVLLPILIFGGLFSKLPFILAVGASALVAGKVVESAFRAPPLLLESESDEEAVRNESA